MATIRERKGVKGKTFQVRYRLDGKEKSESFADKKLARDFKKKIEAEITLGLAKEEVNITFEEYSIEFIKYHGKNIKYTTLKSYEGSLKVINKTIGHIKLKNLKPKKLDEYIVHLLEINKPNTIQQKLTVINMVLSAAKSNKLIFDNPVDSMIVKIKTDRDEEEKKVISFNDFKLFMNSLHYDYMKHFALLAFHTGMRRGEILALRWENFDNNYIYVKDNLNKYMQITTPKSRKSKRKIFVNDNLKQILKDIKSHQIEWKKFFQEEYDDNDLIVCYKNGGYLPPEKITKHFGYVSKQLDIHCHPHMLRHTFASALEDISIKQVQELLGHNKVEMTNKYQHFTEYDEKTKGILNSKFNNVN